MNSALNLLRNPSESQVDFLHSLSLSVNTARDIVKKQLEETEEVLFLNVLEKHFF